jgi:hypothetical protein
MTHKVAIGAGLVVVIGLGLGNVNPLLLAVVAMILLAGWPEQRRERKWTAIRPRRGVPRRRLARRP